VRKKRRSVLVFGAVAAAAVCCAVAGAGTAAGATAALAGPGAGSAPSPLRLVPAGGGSTWGAARELPGIAGLNRRGNAKANSVSCPSAGNCTVGGSYLDQSGTSQAFVADEKAGTWRPAEAVPGTVALNFLTAEVTSVSCSSAGNCWVGGDYNNGVSQAFAADEVHGVWHQAFSPPGTYTNFSGGGSGITSISCTAGYCGAGGFYEGNNGVQQAFVAVEAHGTWQTALQVPGVVELSGNASVNSISCAFPGDCTAVGSYTPQAGAGTFIVSEKNGTWGAAQQVPGIAPLSPEGNANLASVSCASAGNCSAGGSYSDASGKTQAFVVTEKNGTWQPAQEVAGALNKGGNAAINTIACRPAGNCGAGGQYTDVSGKGQAFVVTQKNGSWQSAGGVAGALNKGGNAAIDTIACPSTGNCAAGGSYTGRLGGSQAFVVTQKNGIWLQAQEVAGALNTKGPADVQSVSCPSVGSCTAVGYYGAGGNLEVFTVTGSIIQPTTTAMALSRAKVTYGHEQSERIVVTVKAQYSGTPAGTVTVRAGSATVCTVTLRSGKGSCTLTARKLRRGTYHLIASYHGDQDFLGSTSAKKTLTVN
jgi:Bacterial Ig-like domain (group 3)